MLCPVCDEPVLKHQLEQHRKENHTETSCDMCGRKILKDKLEDHQVHAIVHVHVICMSDCHFDCLQIFYHAVCV